MDKYFKCTTNKPALSYKCGEKIAFTVTARSNYKNIPCQYIKWTMQGDDGKQQSGLASCTAYTPFEIETTLDRPGFVRLTCTPCGSESNPLEDFTILEAGAGAEVEKLSYCDTIPEDFDEYWGEIEKSVAEFTPELIYKKEITAGVPKGFKAYDIRISTFCGRPASGCISIPEGEGKYPLRVGFSGYSVCGVAPDFFKDTIFVKFNAHGFENHLSKIMLEEKYKDEITDSYGFDEQENASNMTTYWRNMMIRNLIGVKFVKTLPEWDGKNLCAYGGSQGALQATTVAAHDKDVTFLDILVPWFCNLNSVNEGYMVGWRPKCAEGLRYFDTVAQSTRVKCPVKISAGLGDYICPPSTTMTLYNTFKVNKAIDFIQGRTHVELLHESEVFHFRFDPENPRGEVKKGVYQHYKGNKYEVIDLAYDSETMEEVVIYKALYGEGKIWVRPKYMFLEDVEVCCSPVKRFKYIG